MNHSHTIQEVLKDYSGTVYKMIALKVTEDSDKLFVHRALPISLKIEDGSESVEAFMSDLSGNQRELWAYFTVDAFSAFTNQATILFGYVFEQTDSITGVNLGAIPPLPSFFDSIPHEIADNAWLASL